MRLISSGKAAMLHTLVVPNILASSIPRAMDSRMSALESCRLMELSFFTHAEKLFGGAIASRMQE